ncbi:MAG: DsrE family protein [Candidatus Bathyarchaeia archaeon]
MPKTLCVIVRRAPYGTIHAAEAIRLVNGGVTYGLKTEAIFIDDGVYVAKADQEAGLWTPLSDALKQTLGLSTVLEDGTESGAEICVHKGSMEARGLRDKDLVKGIMTVGDGELADLLSRADAVITF